MNWEIAFFLLCFFFLKQKTEYEISSRDWSSDVCSSDLKRKSARPPRFFCWARCRDSTYCSSEREIGRASCRERVEISVVAVSLKKKGSMVGASAGRWVDRSLAVVLCAESTG